MNDHTRTPSQEQKRRGRYQLGATLQECFRARFQPKDLNECWEWTGYVNPNGYGKLTYRGRTYRAHRLAWQFHNGKELLPETIVCHSCDNPRCVNPHHLWIDTQAGNMDDKTRKGRQHRGESHPATSLTEEKVRQIRNSRSQGFSYRQIAATVGCTISNVKHVLRGNSWTHVT